MNKIVSKGGNFLWVKEIEGLLEKVREMVKGKGKGKSYGPWLTNQDVPSTVRGGRLHGHMANRQHELLLYHNFYILQYFE